MKINDIISPLKGKNISLNKLIKKRLSIFEDYENQKNFSKEIILDHPLIGAFWGILAGDGCLYSDRKTVSFSGSIEEKEFHEIIYSLMRLIFEIKPTCLKESRNGIESIFKSEKVWKIISQTLNFPVGLKVGKLTLPNFNKKWIMQAIGRLIIDCDGSIRSSTQNKNVPDQLSIQFGQSIKSLRFVNEIKEELLNLNYEITNRASGNLFSIDGTDQVLRFVKQFGIWNPTNIVKLTIWELTGYMPINTREEIVYNYQKGLSFLSNKIPLKYIIPKKHPKFNQNISNFFLFDFLKKDKKELFPNKSFLPKGKIGENAWKMYNLIKRMPGITISEIQKNLKLDAALLRRFAAKMENSKLIKRRHVIISGSSWKRGGAIQFYKLYPQTNINSFKKFLKLYTSY